MARPRLSVRKVKEILRLKYESRLSERAIATACRVSRSTVADYLARGSEAGLTWLLPVHLGEAELEALLFPARVAPVRSDRPMPVFAPNPDFFDASRTCDNLEPGTSNPEPGRQAARANERTRTADLLITSELLYQLSYIGLICQLEELAD